MKRLDVTVQSFGWSDRAKVRLLSHWCPVGGSVGQLLSCCLLLLIPRPLSHFNSILSHMFSLPLLLHSMIIVSYRFMFAAEFFPGFLLWF